MAVNIKTFDTKEKNPDIGLPHNQFQVNLPIRFDQI